MTTFIKRYDEMVATTLQWSYECQPSHGWSEEALKSLCGRHKGSTLLKARCLALRKASTSVLHILGATSQGKEYWQLKLDCEAVCYYSGGLLVYVRLFTRNL